MGEGAGQAVGDLGEGAGELIAAPKDPKEAAKNLAMTAAHEITSAVSDAAKELGQAATRRVKKLGARRRQHHAERHPATNAAQRAAEQLGIDIGAIEGSGKSGRVTVEDVKRAVNGQ